MCSASRLCSLYYFVALILLCYVRIFRSSVVGQEFVLDVGLLNQCQKDVLLYIEPWPGRQSEMHLCKKAEEEAEASGSYERI